MQKAFKMFDADGNGFITKQELKDIAKITFFKVIDIYLNFIELLI